MLDANLFSNIGLLIFVEWDPTWNWNGTKLQVGCCFATLIEAISLLQFLITWSLSYPKTVAATGAGRWTGFQLPSQKAWSAGDPVSYNLLQIVKRSDWTPTWFNRLFWWDSWACSSNSVQWGFVILKSIFGPMKSGAAPQIGASIFPSVWEGAGSQRPNFLLMFLEPFYWRAR